MNKYLVLYRSEGALTGMSVEERMKTTPQEQMAAGMAAWQAWYESSKDAVIDLGAPLGNSTTIVGGSAKPDKTSITGFSLVLAESVAAATELMKNHPHFHMPGASIEILEYVPIPGM
jgi:hypothetical protein